MNFEKYCIKEGFGDVKDLTEKRKGDIYWLYLHRNDMLNRTLFQTGGLIMVAVVYYLTVIKGAS